MIRHKIKRFFTDLKLSSCYRVSNCCNFKMKYINEDYDSNYTCLKCDRPSYFRFKFSWSKFFLNDNLPSKYKQNEW